MSLFFIACTMEGGNLFSAKKTLNIQYPPENAIIKDAFVMGGRILTDKSLEFIEVSFTEIGLLNPKTYGPYPASIDQTENKWVLDFQSLVGDPFLLPDGKYEVSLDSSDINQKRTRQTFIYYIDNSSPLLLLTSPISEDPLSPWEFNSRLIFSGFVSDKSPLKSLIFSFYNEEKELIFEHRETLSSEQWTLEVSKNDALYQSLKKSGSHVFYYTVEAEDAAREYKTAFLVSDSSGNKSDGFYRVQDFISENINEAGAFSRSLFAMLSGEVLTYDQARFFSTKDDLLLKKKITSQDFLENQTYFTVNFADYAPYIQSQSLFLQGEKSRFKNIVSAQESLIFEFHKDHLGAALSEDMSYSLKRKEGEDWVAVFQTGEKMTTATEQSLKQKIDIAYSNLYFGDSLIYVQAAPEILGDYKLEFFVGDKNGISAQDTIWYFTVVEPSPSLFVEIKEINFDNQENKSVLFGISSISDAKDALLNVKSLAGEFDKKLTEIKAKSSKDLGNGLYALNWDVLLDSKDAVHFSNLVFEVKSLGKQNRLYKDFSSLWSVDQRISGGDVKADLSKTEEFAKDFESSIAMQEFVEETFKEKKTNSEKQIFVKPIIGFGENDFDIELHYDYRGAYYNLGYINNQVFIPIVTNKVVKEIYINSETQTGKSLDTNLVELEPGLWQLHFEDPQESVQEILELVAVSDENFTESLRIKVLFDKDKPFIKLEQLKNNFYNKEKPLFVSGVCIDFSPNQFKQNDMESIIEYAVKKNDLPAFDAGILSQLSWNALKVDNPMAWSFGIEPELFKEDGLYSVFVRAKDKSGNYSSLTDASVFSIYVDSQAPEIKINQNTNRQVYDFEDNGWLAPANSKIVSETPYILNLEGTINEKTFFEHGIAYWAYEKEFLPLSGQKTYETVELMEFTLGNRWEIEDILEQKGEYRYVITAIDLAGNISSVDYSLFIK